jgi:ABC-type nickel/cobalt efflux system permease component RcnA
MANLTMLAWPALDPVGSAGQVVGTTLATAAAFFDLPEATRAVLDLQRQIQRSLAQEFRAAHESGSAFGPLVLMAMAFAFGAVHAVTPGHRKAVVASYFLGQGAAAHRGLTMSAKVIATHVLSAIALVTVTTFVIDVSLGMRPADFPVVRLVSYAGVAIVGSWLLWRALWRQGTLPVTAPATKAGPLPYFAGMSPCPLTTIIMVVALANGMVALGLLVSLSMALGMIVTVSLFALAVILSRRWLLDVLKRHAAHVERIARGLEILGAAAVTALGLLLFSSEIV